MLMIKHKYLKTKIVTENLVPQMNIVYTIHVLWLASGRLLHNIFNSSISCGTMFYVGIFLPKYAMTTKQKCFKSLA